MVKAKKKNIKITLKKSYYGRTVAHRKVLEGLGLMKIGRTVEREDTPCIRGMVAKVHHLVCVDEK